MAKVFREEDVNKNYFDGKTVAVVGYGSQGRAHAQNLKDSNVRVVVGGRPGGPSWKQAEEDGFQPQKVEDATRQADLVAILTPDMAQPQVFNEQVAPNMKPGTCVLFAHGFNVQYEQVKPEKEYDVVLVAPKGPGRLVRQQYEEGRGVPCVFAVHQDATGNATDAALAYAHGLGGTRAGCLETTFKEETETDLFGEQGSSLRWCHRADG